MAKIDLKNTSGFPLTYDGDSLRTDKLTFEQELNVGIDEIKNQLLNKSLKCPAIFYKKYISLDTEGIYKSKKLQINLYILKPNLAGIEYVKTKATMNPKYPKILEVIYGGGTILLQKYNSPRDQRIIKIAAKKTQKFIVPAGYASVIVNSRQSSNLIVAEYQHIQTEPEIVLDDTNGMSYYIIRKNAKQEIVRNPYYKIVNEPEILNWDSIISEYGITPKTPIIKQIMRKYEKFDWLFKQNSITI